MKNFFNDPIIILVTVVVAIGYTIVTNMSIANALFLTVAVITGLFVSANLLSNDRKNAGKRK